MNVWQTVDKLEYVSAWGRGQLRINFTSIFSFHKIA